MEKQFFYLKLNLPRATFGQDMTDEDRDIMLQQIAYWKPMVDDGSMIVMGPVFDTKGMYQFSNLNFQFSTLNY